MVTYLPVYLRGSVKVAAFRGLTQGAQRVPTQARP